MVADTTRRCGQCSWYGVLPKNLDAGICYLNPPEVTGIPMQQAPGVIQIKSTALERTVSRNRPACRHFKHKGGAIDAKSS